jgi:hypothetical protein
MTAECVPKVSVMLWGCITWNGVGTLCQVNGNINAEKYISALDSQIWPVIARHLDVKIELSRFCYFELKKK